MVEIELKTEPKIRWAITQNTKGLNYELVVRGETIDEVKKLAEQSKEELIKLCQQ